MSRSLRLPINYFLENFLLCPLGSCSYLIDMAESLFETDSGGSIKEEMASAQLIDTEILEHC